MSSGDLPVLGVRLFQSKARESGLPGPKIEGSKYFKWQQPPQGSWAGPTQPSLSWGRQLAIARRSQALRTMYFWTPDPHEVRRAFCVHLRTLCCAYIFNKFCYFMIFFFNTKAASSVAFPVTQETL